MIPTPHDVNMFVRASFIDCACTRGGQTSTAHIHTPTRISLLRIVCPLSLRPSIAQQSSVTQQHQQALP